MNMRRLNLEEHEAIQVNEVYEGYDYSLVPSQQRKLADLSLSGKNNKPKRRLARFMGHEDLTYQNSSGKKRRLGLPISGYVTFNPLVVSVDIELGEFSIGFLAQFKPSLLLHLYAQACAYDILCATGDINIGPATTGVALAASIEFTLEFLKSVDDAIELLPKIIRGCVHNVIDPWLPKSLYLGGVHYSKADGLTTVEGDLHLPIVPFVVEAVLEIEFTAQDVSVFTLVCTTAYTYSETCGRSCRICVYRCDTVTTGVQTCIWQWVNTQRSQLTAVASVDLAIDIGPIHIHNTLVSVEFLRKTFV